MILITEIQLGIVRMNKYNFIYFACFCNTGNFKWHSSGANTKIKQMIYLLEKTKRKISFFNYAPKEKIQLNVKTYNICSSFNPVKYRLEIFGACFKFRKLFESEEKIKLILYNANLVSFIFYLSTNFFSRNTNLIIQVEDLPYARTDNTGLKGTLDKWCFKYLISKTSTALFASSGMLNEAKKKYGFKCNALLFPPTISNEYLNIISSRKEPFRSSKIVIMYAGSFNKDKGIVDLVEAFTKAGLKEYELHLYGPSPKKFIEKYNKSFSIKIFGSVSFKKLYFAYANSDIVVNPHLKIVNNSFIFPCKNIEVLASGALPLVSKHSLVDFPVKHLPKSCIFETSSQLVNLLINSKLIWNKDRNLVKKVAKDIRFQYSQDFIADSILKNL